MSKIFLVRGSTGEYSDRLEWIVAAYRDESRAKAHAEAARQWAEKAVEECGDEPWKISQKQNPHDPHMSVDYTGVIYGVQPVDFIE
jgi:hypothetical protein